MRNTSKLIRPFGHTTDGREATLYILENNLLRVQITDFGGRIVSVEVPDRNSQRQHVLLGFDSVAEYESAGGAFGALLGRNANRIAEGRFALDGHTYGLSKNDRGSTLHGGKVGFDTVFWRVDGFDGDKLVLGHLSSDGDQGFPGELSVRATYHLDGTVLSLTMEAKTTKATPVSLSAHPYFNLAGLPARDMLDHEFMIAANRFLPTDAKQIPTGEVRQVLGTPFDFRESTVAGARIHQADSQLVYGKGYDHYYVLETVDSESPRLGARVRHPQSGRMLEVFTTQLGMQFYTGNNLNGSIAGRGGIYRQSAGFALEPQGFPNAVNQANFPTTVLRPNSDYCEVIKYRFATDSGSI
jgi:aldose 1-epimerase